MYGVYGAPGLASFFLMFFLPAIAFVIRYPALTWTHPKVAPVSALPIILVMYMWDSSLNAFPNSVYFIAVGGLCGLLSEPPERLESSKLSLPGAKSKHVPVRQV
jgi:O-antigen ligase